MSDIIIVEPPSAQKMCPLCGERMVVRVARRGTTKGQTFWGCTGYPACKETAPASHSDSKRPEQPPDITLREKTATPPMGHPAVQRRVDWTDATVERPGWQTHYATVGASLRSIPSPMWSSVSNCWVASEGQPADDVPSAPAETVVAAMRKLLARGNAPPLHPDAERALLARFGIPLATEAAHDQGDIAPRVGAPVVLTSTDFALPVAANTIAPAKGLTGSPAEEALMRHLYRTHPEIARWLIPQPSLDGLLKAFTCDQTKDDSEHGHRRGDFLLMTDSGRYLLEVDGAQHAHQRPVDDSRDRDMSRAGVQVRRVPASEAMNGFGPSLDDVVRTCSEATTPLGTSSNPHIVWAAVQTHRLVLALCEAMTRGWLSGERWNIHLEDQTGAAAHLLGPYLGMIHALDLLWANGQVTPREVNLSVGNGRRIRWERIEVCTYVKSSLDDDEDGIPTTDVHILLDPSHGPVADLPAPCDASQVIVRSCRLPMLISDRHIGLPRRLTPFINCFQEHHEVVLTCLLRGIFAKRAFREGQLEAVQSSLSGNDSLVLLPTGAGKSLIYQLAGLCLPGKTLIVGPLAALIDDQQEALQRQGIDRTVGITARNVGLQDTADAFFVFIAPERLQRQSFRDELTSHSSIMPINLVVVDEAHCVSEWGHNFRYAYLNFGNLLRRTCDGVLGVPPMLALTGTASRAVLTDVMFQLGISDSKHTIIKPVSFDRKELSYHVIVHPPQNAWAALDAEMRALPALFSSPSSFYGPTGDQSTYSGIVFVTTVSGERGMTATLARIRKWASTAVCFSGSPPRNVNQSLWAVTKQKNARKFKDNKASVIVTTKSFGMGIDKSNVRWVLHFGLPMSLEGYYQEVGRAGRDGHSAQCVMILVEQNHKENRLRLGDGDRTVELAKRKKSDSDDIDTAMFFHEKSFPPMQEEVDRVMVIYDLITSGQTNIPLGNRNIGLHEDHSERALHRLAVLGVVADYTLRGYGRNTTASLRCNSLGGDEIVANLVEFVERSQPGRAQPIRNTLARNYGSDREALVACVVEVVAFVYDTIERSRRRSLREMWLVAADAAAKKDGEIIRQRVLEYLTEGDIATLIQRLAETAPFAFADWLPHWSTITASSEVREWRAASARLLASYPDHPGLLASRGIAEGLLPDGDPAEFEENLSRAFRLADSYGSSDSDQSTMAQWLLGVFPSDARSSCPFLTTQSPCLPFPDCAAVVIEAARCSPHTNTALTEWLASNWQHGEALSLYHLNVVMAKLAESLNALDELDHPHDYTA